MSNVTIQVIPGVKAIDYGYTPHEDKPLEDYSLLLMAGTKEGKHYQAGTFISNTALPLTAKMMDTLRDAIKEKMEHTT